MKYSAIYTKNRLFHNNKANEIITLASIAKWFYLGYFLDKKHDQNLQSIVNEMMIYSSNPATTKLAEIFGADNVQKYVDEITKDIFIYGSQKSKDANKSNEGTLLSVCEFLYYLAKKYDLREYKSSIHRIVAEALNITNYANKPGSSPKGSRYFLGDSLILYTQKEPIIIVAMTETFNPHLKLFPLKIFKRFLLERLKVYIKKELTKELESVLREQ